MKQDSYKGERKGPAHVFVNSSFVSKTDTLIKIKMFRQLVTVNFTSLGNVRYALPIILNFLSNISKIPGPHFASISNKN